MSGKPLSNGGDVKEGIRDLRGKIDDGITNPRYSPVVPDRGSRTKLAEATRPEYIELGLKNPAYDGEERNGASALSTFKRPAVPAPEGAAKIPQPADPTYLLPVESPTARVYSKPADPQYEDLGHVLAKLEHGSSVTTNLPKKKSNLLYEPSEVKNKKEKQGFHEENGKQHRDVPCCLVCALVIIGLFALFGTVVSVLIMGGAVKAKNCQCETTNRASNTGSQTGSAYSQNQDLALKLSLLASNMTALQLKMIPQEMEIVRLQNLTNQYQQKINALQNQLLEEEKKSKKLNTSVVQLNNLQAMLKSTTEAVNKTLSANISDLQTQINNQQIKTRSMNVNMNSNISNLSSKLDSVSSQLDSEAMYRRGNDSLVRSELESKARINRELITNLTASLASLNAKTQADIFSSEIRFGLNLNQSVQKLQNSDQLLSKNLVTLNNSLSTKITNISLTPGPQGPVGKSGVGNLTGCYSDTRYTHTGGTRGVSDRLTIPNNMVVTGVFCYADTVVSTKYVLMPFNTHRCECLAKSVLPDGYNCHIIAWYCPKTS